ncbi:MAG: tripartite tricarboxylate transporter substrate-binding protein [Pigmentiphaga sp.]|uniref:Bug family tripartite tricarboxylate transporter substrate binding protein n=1 Tax=Pigmentiphaga sp. TaxID=1977564 RepID=UPI0029A81BC8|nr:tripartite tricarboxylate transporter substrate-binding protein [Pigmentiphaga sp.]MDX3906080.1 tripartite tricarboxylate transporter substrate-binding protein [Pigmentiphaga sp.]
MNPRRLRIGSIFAGLALLWSAAAPQAQTYPTKPVRMIVPYAPGGAPDVLARSLSPSLSETFKQQFVVENRPGAGGIGAAKAVAHSSADGQVLFFSDIQQLAINPYLFAKLPYQAAKDFTPVTLAAAIPLYVAVQSSLNVHNLADLAALAKAKPGMLTYGSSGIGSIHHITMESLKNGLGVDIVHVPYKGAGQSVPAFMGGETSLVIAAYPALEQYVKTGKARIIAVTTLERPAMTPDVPAVSETIPGFDFSSEMGIVVPAGTPAPIVKQLSSAVASALKHPDAVQRLNAMGATAIGSTPEGYAANIRTNLEKFGKAVKLAGITPN